MITEEEKKEMIEWVSALTDPPAFHHITILKNSSDDKEGWNDGLTIEESHRVYRDQGEDTEAAGTGKILYMKKFVNPLNTGF